MNRLAQHPVLDGPIRRFAALVLLTSLVVLGLPNAAQAEWVASRCDTRWKTDAQVEGLNWCVVTGYNSTTGTIQGVFSYSDYAAGNVYRVHVEKVILWRDDGSISQKDSCSGCPTWQYVYDGADQVGTGWSGFVCNRDYWTMATFSVQWDQGGDVTAPVTKNSPRVSLC